MLLPLVMASPNDPSDARGPINQNSRGPRREACGGGDAAGMQSAAGRCDGGVRGRAGAPPISVWRLHRAGLSA